MYWQTSLSYQINNKYSISLYQYLGENDETTWTTGEDRLFFINGWIHKFITRLITIMVHQAIIISAIVMQ